MIMTGLPTSATIALDVCVDCSALLANGEVTDEHGADITQAHAALMREQWDSDVEISLGHLSDGHCDNDPCECESSFSWRPCNGCGSRLGGDREHATAWPTD